MANQIFESHFVALNVDDVDTPDVENIAADDYDYECNGMDVKHKEAEIETHEMSYLEVTSIYSNKKKTVEQIKCLVFASKSKGFVIM